METALLEATMDLKVMVECNPFATNNYHTIGSDYNLKLSILLLLYIIQSHSRYLY